MAWVNKNRERECKRLWSRANRARRIKTKQCTCCPARAVKGRRQCRRCLDRATAWSTARLAKRRRAKKCIWCPAPQGATRFCRSCWFRSIALRVLGTSLRGPELEAKFDAQDGRCYYTNVRLHPGRNASIDHQHPRVRGGGSTLRNLRWVDLKVNLLKRDLTHREFVRLCRLIAHRFR